MTDTDTSDEAAFKYYRNWVGDPEFGFIKMWQECRRRSEAVAKDYKREYQLLLRAAYINGAEMASNYFGREHEPPSLVRIEAEFDKWKAEL